jgi:hypothetical protein
MGRFTLLGRAQRLCAILDEELRAFLLMFGAENWGILIMLRISQLLLHFFPTLDMTGTHRAVYVIAASAVLVVALDASTLLPSAPVAGKSEPFFLNCAKYALLFFLVGKPQFGNPIHTRNMRPDVS